MLCSSFFKALLVAISLIIAISTSRAVAFEGQSLFAQVKLHPIHADEPKAVPPEIEVVKKAHPAIDPEERDGLFASVGLSKHLDQFDELEKNVLFLRLKDLKLEQLARLYPKIPRPVLTKAQAAVRRR